MSNKPLTSEQKHFFLFIGDRYKYGTVALNWFSELLTITRYQQIVLRNPLNIEEIVKDV